MLYILVLFLFLFFFCNLFFVFMWWWNIWLLLNSDDFIFITIRRCHLTSFNVEPLSILMLDKLVTVYTWLATTSIILVSTTVTRRIARAGCINHSSWTCSISTLETYYLNFIARQLYAQNSPNSKSIQYWRAGGRISLHFRLFASSGFLFPGI